jgi:hypothetical protein
MEMPGWRWMLLVLLLGGQRLETPGIAVWTACFRDENGRQRRISTKETNNKKALKIAEEFESAAKTKRTLKQVQKVLDRLAGRGALSREAFTPSAGKGKTT